MTTEPEAREIKSFVSIVNGVVATILAAGILWQASETASLGKKMAVVENSLSGIHEILGRDKEFVELRIKQQKLEIENSMSVIAGQIRAMEKVLKQLQHNDSQQWPRLRAMGENIAILKNHITRLHPNTVIHLEEPEKF